MDFDPRGFDSFESDGRDGGGFGEFDKLGDLGDLHELDADFLEKAKVSWLTRMLLGLSLGWGMSRLAKELSLPGIETSKKAHAFFQKIERVDIVPSRSNMRGFQLILDGLLSLYFSQDGDHFIYDGFEMGPYDPGDVEIFDKLRDR